MHRLDSRDRRHGSCCTPGHKFFGVPVVGPARVRVSDVGREEFEETHRGALTVGGDKRRQWGRVDRDELGHPDTIPIDRPPALFGTMRSGKTRNPMRS
jgi:hypothetical protein